MSEWVPTKRNGSGWLFGQRDAQVGARRRLVLVVGALLNTPNATRRKWSQRIKLISNTINVTHRSPGPLKRQRNLQITFNIVKCHRRFQMMNQQVCGRWAVGDVLDPGLICSSGRVNLRRSWCDLYTSGTWKGASLFGRHFCRFPCADFPGCPGTESRDPLPHPRPQ